MLTSPFIFMQLRSELPYMSTPRRKVLKALECISNRQGSRSRHAGASVRRRNFHDLGSGDGEAVLAAASAGWDATGVEMNPTLWLVSQIRRIFSPSHVRQKSRFILGDLFKHNVQSADAVMIFGVQPLMPRIAAKIAKECEATCVMSYRFRIPLQEEEKTSGDTDTLNATLIFDDEEMRVWEIDARKRSSKTNCLE